MTDTAEDYNCPDCGSPLIPFEDGSCAGSKCTTCDWAVATTNHNTPAFDKTLYTVWPESPTLDRSHLIAKLAVALALKTREAMELVDSGSPIAQSMEAWKVIQLSNTLSLKGISIRVEPTFPWPLAMPNHPDK